MTTDSMLKMTSGKPHDYRFQVEKMARIELS
jgi:hypothetical protein